MTPFMEIERELDLVYAKLDSATPSEAALLRDTIRDLRARQVKALPVPSFLLDPEEFYRESDELLLRKVL